MTDTHNKSFFGQNTGLILNSTSKAEPYIFMRCIKRKAIGEWEKPSNGEGKVIKISIEEIIMILQVVNRELMNWSSYHTYKDNKTPISFGWEDKKANTLWVNIGNYSKMLNFAQAELLKHLLTHILAEKIEFATSSNKVKTNSNKVKNTNYENPNTIKNKDDIIEFKESSDENIFEENFNNSAKEKENKIPDIPKENKLLKEMSDIEGAIKGETEKALLIDFSGYDIWVPKSTIHCQYTPRKNMSQKFLIDNWILKRNKIIT